MSPKPSDTMDEAATRMLAVMRVIKERLGRANRGHGTLDCPYCGTRDGITYRVAGPRAMVASCVNKCVEFMA